MRDLHYLTLAELSAGRSVVDYRRIALPTSSGAYSTPRNF